MLVSILETRFQALQNVYKATLKTSTDSEVYAHSSPPKAMRLTECS